MKVNIRIIVLICCLLGLSSALEAQCPFGDKVNCLGECGRFTDENGDSFCDFSKVEAAQPSVEEIKDTTTNSVSQHQERSKEQSETKPRRQNRKERNRTAETVTEQPQVEPAQSETQTLQSSTQTSTTVEPKKETKQSKPYNIITISCICLGLYLLTFILVKTDKIKKLTHRKIWNVALLITFLVSCLLGFLLALQLNYHFGMQWLRPILKLHVEFGIAMTIVAVFHLIWHLKYYSKIFKK